MNEGPGNWKKYGDYHGKKYAASLTDAECARMERDMREDPYWIEWVKRQKERRKSDRRDMLFAFLFILMLLLASYLWNFLTGGYLGFSGGIPPSMGGPDQ